MTPLCSCLPLNRKLMAVLLKVDEGSVHEQGCLENAAQEARQQERERLAFEVEALNHTGVLGGRGYGTIHEPTREAVLSILRETEA